MRALTAPALLSHKLTQSMPTEHPDTVLQYLARPKAALVLKALAGGEIIGDKLPNSPNRTSPPQFIVRIASGATCGALISEAEGQPMVYGAALGGLGAVAGTLIFFTLRRWLDHDLGLPDAVGAVAEDLLAVGGGWAVVNGMHLRAA